jgi:hypothetical protein
VEPGDRDSESLYQDELDQGRGEDLRRKLDAVERAEARLDRERHADSRRAA